MTMLYKLMFLMTINGEAHPISMQEELTQDMCSEQVKRLTGTMLLVKADRHTEPVMKVHDGSYFCIPQRLTGV